MLFSAAYSFVINRGGIVKKIFLLFFICVMVLSSCSRNNFSLSQKDAEIYTLDTVEAFDFVEANKNDELDASEFYEDVEKTKKFIFFEKEYNLEYSHSAKFLASDLCVTVYKETDSLTDVYFYFNSKDKSLVRAGNIPFCTDEFTEKQFWETISRLSADRIDLTEMVLEETTNYLRISENEISANTVSGFYHSSNENEIIRYRTFYYTQNVNGIKGEKRLTAEFVDGMMTLEIIDGYDLTEADLGGFSLSDAKSNLENFIRKKHQG